MTMTSENPDLITRIEDHEERILAVESWKSATDAKLDAINREVIANRAESSARGTAASQGMDRLGAQVSELTRQISEHTGAQKKLSELKDEELRDARIKNERWKRYSIVIGIVCAISAAVGGTLLSDQEVASTIWVKYFHWQEPWGDGK